MRADAVGDFEEQAAAVLRSGLRPRTGIEGSHRGLDGAIDIGGISVGNFSDDLFRGGVVDGEPGAAMAFHALAVDVHSVTVHT